jgi:hypothetical protein
VGVLGRKDHVFLSGDKRIEDERGIHHGFSTWEEVRVYTQGKIIPE